MWRASEVFREKHHFMWRVSEVFRENPFCWSGNRTGARAYKRMAKWWCTIINVLTLIKDVAPPVVIFNLTPELKNKTKTRIRSGIRPSLPLKVQFCV
jgi:hypothetical protein